MFLLWIWLYVLPKPKTAEEKKAEEAKKEEKKPPPYPIAKNQLSAEKGIIYKRLLAALKDTPSIIFANEAMGKVLKINDPKDEAMYQDFLKTLGGKTADYLVCYEGDTYNPAVIITLSDVLDVATKWVFQENGILYLVWSEDADEQVALLSKVREKVVGMIPKKESPSPKPPTRFEVWVEKLKFWKWGAPKKK